MSIENIQNSVEYVRVHGEMYLPSDSRPLADKLLLQLASDAITLGVTDIAVIKQSGWIFVGSDCDWLQCGGFRPATIRELFFRVIPLLEAGQNSIRHEIVVNAFSEKVVIFSKDELIAIGGICEFEEKYLTDVFRILDKARAIAFLSLSEAKS